MIVWESKYNRDTHALECKVRELQKEIEELTIRLDTARSRAESAEFSAKRARERLDESPVEQVKKQLESDYYKRLQSAESEHNKQMQREIEFTDSLFEAIGGKEVRGFRMIGRLTVSREDIKEASLKAVRESIESHGLLNAIDWLPGDNTSLPQRIIALLGGKGK